MAGQSIMCVCSIHLESFLTWGHGRDCRVVLLYVFPIYYSNNGFSIPYVLLLYIFREKRSWKNGLENTIITTNTSSIFQNITSATYFVTTDNHISMISHSGTCLFYRIGSIFTTQYGEMLFQSKHFTSSTFQDLAMQRSFSTASSCRKMCKIQKWNSEIVMTISED